MNEKPRAMIFVDGFYLLSVVTRFSPAGQAKLPIRIHRMTKHVLQDKRQGAAHKYFRYYDIRPHTADLPDGFHRRQAENILRFQNMLAKLSYVELVLANLTVIATYRQAYTWVNMAVDLVEMARNDAFDEVLLVANTDTLRKALDRVRNFGKAIHLFTEVDTGQRLKEVSDTHTPIDQNFIDAIAN